MRTLGWETPVQEKQGPERRPGQGRVSQDSGLPQVSTSPEAEVTTCSFHGHFCSVQSLRTSSLGDLAETILNRPRNTED